MPIINGTLSYHGAVVDLLVGVHEARRDVLKRNGFSVPKRRVLRAQIDTGTTFTAVEGTILEAMEIRVTNKVLVANVSPTAEPIEFNVCPVSIGIKGSDEDIELHVPELEVLACGFGNGDVQALIGRDVLRHCLFSYNGPTNGFSLAY